MSWHETQDPRWCDYGTSSKKKNGMGLAVGFPWFQSWVYTLQRDEKIRIIQTLVLTADRERWNYRSMGKMWKEEVTLSKINVISTGGWNLMTCNLVDFADEPLAGYIYARLHANISQKIINWDLRFLGGILRNLDLYFYTGVSWQPFGPNWKALGPWRWDDSSVTTFWNNLSVPSSRVINIPLKLILHSFDPSKWDL